MLTRHVERLFFHTHKHTSTSHFALVTPHTPAHPFIFHPSCHRSHAERKLYIHLKCHFEIAIEIHYSISCSGILHYIYTWHIYVCSVLPPRTYTHCIDRVDHLNLKSMSECIELKFKIWNVVSAIPQSYKLRSPSIQFIYNSMPIFNHIELWSFKLNIYLKFIPIQFFNCAQPMLKQNTHHENTHPHIIIYVKCISTFPPLHESDIHQNLHNYHQM